MHIVGNYRIEPNKLVTVSAKGVDVGPYLYIDSTRMNFHADTEVTLSSSTVRTRSAFILDTLVPLDKEDGFVLWFYAAQHPRLRISRRQLRNCFVLASTEGGSSLIAVASSTGVAEMVFYYREYKETAILTDGVPTFITEKDTHG